MILDEGGNIGGRTGGVKSGRPRTETAHEMAHLREACGAEIMVFQKSSR
jgi:hypothetical protein